MRKHAIFMLAALLTAAIPATIAAQQYAITNATIVTVTQGTINNGTLVIDGESISAIGANVSVPSGAVVIDGTGLMVYPGMINTNTSLGLTEIGGVTQTQDQNETGAYNTFIRASQGVNPNTIMKGIARWNGITTVITSPRNQGQGVFAGHEVLLNLNGWTVDEMTVRDPVAMQMTFPAAIASGGRGRGGRGRGGQTSSNREDLRKRSERIQTTVKALFDKTRLYIKAKEDFAAGRRSTPPAPDPTLEGLIPVVQREVPVSISVGGVDNIRDAIKFVQEANIRAVFVGASDAWKIADELVQADIPILYSQLLSSPGQGVPYDLYYTIPSLLSKSGVKFAFSISSASGMFDLPFHAGMAVAYGLSKDEALKAVTLYPAQMYGVDDIMGSLEVGKMANIVVTNGDMLEPSTKVLYEFIRGEKVDLDDNYHYKLYMKYRSRIKK